MEEENILICGLNWVGDSIISMPALQAYRRHHPGCRITLMVKEKMKNLWSLHPVPDRIVVLESGLGGAWSLGRSLREERFDKGFVLPHSFRSALIPWLARIPDRIGMPGHFRDAMLTRVVRPRNDPERTHQAYEYMDLMAPEELGKPLEPPQLRCSAKALNEARENLQALPSTRIGLIPGAARGPSKQWPGDHFIKLGRALTAHGDIGLAIFGSPEETVLCETVAKGIGGPVKNFAGKTNFMQWTALMEACSVLVANDSGGMHLAGALNRPVVALYGITDPDKTGPLGDACRIFQKSAFRSRDVARHSREARRCLESITPEEVTEAVLSFLPGTPPGTREDGSEHG